MFVVDLWINGLIFAISELALIHGLDYIQRRFICMVILQK